jgi:hypothetical protein
MATATTKEYWVPNNTWTKEILGRGSYDPEVKINTINYLINVDVTTNPALDCEKGFEAVYTCGKYTNTEKTISIAPEALGKTANFNCAVEAAVCTPLKLTLDDEGTLTLTNTSGGDTLWSSAEIPGAKVTPETAIALDKYKAPQGKYPRNYLLPGETLDISGNEWIGSPSGKYRLMMSKDGLQVVYNAYGCDTIMNGGGTGASDPSVLLYTLSSSFTQFIGKLGYVNDAGQLQLYPDLAQYYVNTYETIGNYKVLGADIGAPTARNNATACQTKCNTEPTCAGFVYDLERKMCQLKNKDVYQSNRIINEKYQYQLRNKGVNVDVSCPTEVTTDTSLFWENTPKDGTNMSSTTKCGLAAYTEGERTAVAEKKVTLDIAVTSDFKSMMTTLLDKYALLKKTVLSTISDTDTASSDLHTNESALGALNSGQYDQLQAMSEDTDLNMMSQNYRHIMWSILAIVIIMATIKIAK